MRYPLFDHRNAPKRRRRVKTYLFRVVVEADDDRWFAHAPALEEWGAATWGRTREEALRNIEQVLRMTVEGMMEHGEVVPEEPEADVQVFAEPRVAVTI